MRSSLKGIFTVFGGFLLHIIVGTVYTMPFISRYFYSYLIRHNSETLTYKNIESMFTINIVVLSCVVPIGVLVNRYLGVINSSCIGLMLIIGGQALMIFKPEYQIVKLALIASAIGSSLVNIPILITIWKFYPVKKGISTSLCLSGLGLNRLVFKYASLKIINPGEVGLTEKMDRYPEIINENFIFYMKLLLCFYCIIGLLAMLFISSYDDVEQEEKVNYENDRRPLNTANSTLVENDQNTINSSSYMSYSASNDASVVNSQAKTKEIEKPLCALLLSVPFIQLTSMYFCSRIFSTIELSSMKKFGIMNGHSESFVTLSSWIWKFVNFACFQYWGLLIDKISFKKVYMSIILIQIATSSSFYFIAENKYSFLLCYLLTSAVNSGNIILVPLSYIYIFGIDNGALLFSVSSMITNVFYICRPLFRSFVNEKISFLIFYLVISLFSMFGLIILCFFNEKRRTKNSKALSQY